MQLGDAIKKRRSVKRFSNTKPDWRKVLRAMDYARFAPMAGNLNVLKFVLVRDKDKIDKLSDAAQQSFISDAEIVVVAVSEDEKLKRMFDEKSEFYARQQAGAIIQNFLLGLEEQNLSTCWVGYFSDELVKEILEIPQGLTVEAMFPIGKKSKSKTSSERSEKEKPELENMLFFDEWKNKFLDKKTRVKHENV